MAKAIEYKQELVKSRGFCGDKSGLSRKPIAIGMAIMLDEKGEGGEAAPYGGW